MFFQIKSLFSFFADHKETPWERLNWAKDQIRSVDKGRALLRLAEENGIDITPAELGADLGKLLYDSNRLFVSDTMSKEIMVFVLAHELIHAQQHSNGLFDEQLSASQRDAILLTRLSEGDANANAGLLVKQINAAQGLSLPYPYHSVFGLGLRGVFNQLCGRTSPDAYVLNRLFKNFQNSFSARFYDKNIGKWTKEEWDLPDPLNLLQVARSGIEKTMHAGDRENFSYLKAQSPEDVFKKLEKYARKALRKLG